MAQNLLNGLDAHPEWDKVLAVVNTGSLPFLADALAKRGFSPARLQTIWDGPLGA